MTEFCFSFTMAVILSNKKSYFVFTLLIFSLSVFASGALHKFVLRTNIIPLLHSGVTLFYHQ